MKSYAEILTTPAADTPGTAVLIHFDTKRYIFGHIAEGTQRAISERNARLGKVQEIFLTGRTEWATSGGLIGLILTLGDQHKHNSDARDKAGKPVESPGVVVHGGEGLLHSIAATRSFVLRQALRLKVDEILEEDTGFEDENVKVKALFIRPEQKPELSRKRSIEDVGSRKERMQILRRTVESMFWTDQQNVNVADTENPLQAAMEQGSSKKPRMATERHVEEGETGFARHPAPVMNLPNGKPCSVANLPNGKPSPLAMSYIVKCHDHRGKFLPQVAKSLGVKPGPDFRKLTSGESVTTTDGKVVEPHEVMEPTRKGAWIGICDIPEPNYIPEFIAQRDWTDGLAQERFQVFFWVLGQGVSEDARLREFMANFPNAKHIVAGRDVCPNSLKFKGAAKFNARLNKLDPVFFPEVVSSELPEKEAPEGAVVAKPGLVWNIAPKPALVEDQITPPFDKEDAINSLGPSFLETLNEVHTAEQPAPEKFVGSDVEMITLGTGSALPSRFRNVSATLVRLPTEGSILLDCGENTLGQLQRLFTPDELKQRLRDIKALYISHLHADHHLGAIAVLKAQNALVGHNQKTFVVAPQRFHTFLEEYSSVEDFGRNRLVFIQNEHLRPHLPLAPLPPSKARSQLYAALALSDWRTAYANHCQSSFTTAITFESGFKLSYSGDTRPTQSFVDIGQNSTVLLHEATFDDELIHEAIAKKHCTISEAVEAGRDMKARKTALTHFSQRYPKRPNMEVGGEQVIYGFDYMRFEVGDIGRFRGLAKGLEAVYADVEKEGPDDVQASLN